ncbi:unnamed protein product [Prorocentrum cordatum]|uniref:Protein kinase domain-containing protein n=1 Tax=Prorocentrum cordatum TaxID=2364126 RepID=A0ABN9RXT5_9DINO|nr:unnamed protein product [Polarella glacialis]
METTNNTDRARVRRDGGWGAAARRLAEHVSTIVVLWAADATVAFPGRRLLGAGSYGVVCEAQDLGQQGRALVAIKRIPRVFEHVVDGKRILREIAILRTQKLGPSSRVVRLLDVLVPDGRETFQESSTL